MVFGDNFLKMTVIRKHIRKFNDGTFWINMILLCVVGNTIVLSMDGLFDDDPTIVDLFQNLNLSFTVLFAIEMLVKILAYGVISKFS